MENTLYYGDNPDILAGKKIDMPPIRQVGATFKKAERHRPKGGE